MGKDRPKGLGSYHVRSRHKIIHEWMPFTNLSITLNFRVLNNNGKTHSFPEDMGWYFLPCKDDFHNK